MIAALYVETGGVYFGLPNVDPWGEARDARLYRGPHRVVAHPPCQRWGRYWSGGPSRKFDRHKGDDGGCFAHAIWVARTFGGVIEHPEASHAWRWFNLVRPPKSGGWVSAGDEYGALTCCVEQGHYGHKARKATWLYYIGPKPPELNWGKASGKIRLDDGCRSKEHRAKGIGVSRDRMLRREQARTPPAFRDLLIALAAEEDEK